MCSQLLLLPLLAFAPPAVSTVTATRLDGTAIRGELRAWEDTHIVIAGADGDVRVAADQLLSLDWQPAPLRNTAGTASTSAQVELIDGSLLPIDDFRSQAARATATLAAPLPEEDKQVALERKQLAAVRLQPLSPAAADHWREIRHLDLTGDVLVLLKRDGKSLDYIEGVLGDVLPEKIEFKLDGEPLRINPAQVAGFLYFRSTDDAGAEPLCVVQGRSGLRAAVVRARLADRLLRLTTASGAKFAWPLHDIHSADYSAGKLQYLSDMQPLSQRWTPLVGLPAGATLAAEYGQPRFNHSAYGGPLAVRLGDPPHTSTAAQTRSFRKGLALRSRTEIVYRVPAGFRRFAATAGIDPATSGSGNVRLEVYGDDRLLWEDDIAGQAPPTAIELDVAGLKRLKIVVDYGRNLDSGDWLNLCDARIVK